MPGALLRSTLVALASLCTLLGTNAAEAQIEGPRISFSPHAGAAVWLDDIDLATDVLLGGRMGLALGPWFGVEGTLDVTPTHAAGDADAFERVTHGSVGAIVRLAPRHRLSPYLTAGWSNLHFDPSGGSETNVGGFEAGAGVEIGLAAATGRRVDLRLDVRNVFLDPDDDSPWAGSTQNTLLVSAGLQFTMGGSPGDGDGDGVVDRLDRCPDTVAGARVDAQGCALDLDADGVPDGLDRCPATPAGVRVDATGCATDEDRDGVADGLDLCEGTPLGAVVDAGGCPTDGDGDGVVDGLDRCPDTPEGVIVDVATGCALDGDLDGVPDGVDLCEGTPRGVVVDASGCPVPTSIRETELLDTGLIRLDTVRFESGKATLLPESFVALNEVAEILARWPQLRIEIGGHTDSVGDEARNLELSRERAEAVYEWIRGSFPSIPDEQLVVRGYGETRSIATNDTAEGRARNRRVEFRVLNTEVLEKD